MTNLVSVAAAPEAAVVQLKTYSQEAIGLEGRAGELKALALATVVVDATSLEKATELLTEVKRDLKALEADKELIYRPAKTVVDEISRRYKAASAPFEEAEKLLKGKIGDFQAEQARKAAAAAEEERRRREEAALAEEKRQAELRAEQEAAVRAQAEQEAARLAAEGKTEQAEQVKAQAEETITTIAQDAEAQTLAMFDATAKVEVDHKATVGAATTRMVWTHELVDLAKVPVEFLSLNTGAVQKAIREGAREIPGLRIYQAPSVSVRI